MTQSGPDFLHLLRETKDKVSAVSDHVTTLRTSVASEEFSTDKGISLLELKYHLQLSYLINLTQLMLLKSEGCSIAGCEPIQRLVEIRTVLEKVRPLDHKLRYQIDKLIRMATTGLTDSTNDPLHFKPNPASLMSKVSGLEEEEEDETAKPRVYVPPKVMAMPYEDEGKGRQQTKAEREHKKVLRSSVLLQELRSEFTDTPEEIHDIGAGWRKQKEAQEEKEIEKLEEDNFLRLSRKRKRQDPGRGARGVVEELTDFSALRGLTREQEEEEEEWALNHKRKTGRGTRRRNKKGLRK